MQPSCRLDSPVNGLGVNRCAWMFVWWYVVRPGFALIFLRFFVSFLSLTLNTHTKSPRKRDKFEQQKKLNRKNSLVRFYHWHFWSNNACLSVDDDGSMFKCYRREHGRAWEMVINIFWWLSYHFFTLSLCHNRILIGLRLTSRSRLAHQHTHTRRRRFLCRTNTRAQRWFSRNSKSCFSFIAFAISALFDWNLCTDCKEFTLSRENFESFRFSRSRVCATYMRNMSKCDRASVLRATVITITCRLSSLGARFTVYHARPSLRRQNCLLISTKPQKMARNFFTPRKFLELFFSLFTFSHFQVRERRNKYASRVTLNAVKLNSLRTLSKFLV